MKTPDDARALLEFALRALTQAGDAPPPPLSRRMESRGSLSLPVPLEAMLTGFSVRCERLHPARFTPDPRRSVAGDLSSDAGLVSALIEEGRRLLALAAAPAAPAVAAKAPAIPPSERDTLQGYLREWADSALDQGQIGFLEGSTGVGKSRVIGYAALRQLQRCNQPCAVVAPTVASLAHLAAETRLAAADLGVPMPPAVVLLGRKQFVSVEKVRLLAEHLLVPPCEPAESEAAEKALKWLDAGGPTATAGTCAMALVCPVLGLLVEDLHALVPRWTELFEVADYQLDPPDASDPGMDEGGGEDAPPDQPPAEPAAGGGAGQKKLTAAERQEQALEALDPAEKLYRRLHQLAALGALAGRSAPLVFLTHAKLCYSMRLRVLHRFDALPNWRALLVDEAHELERQMSAACSQDLSLIWLRAELRRLAAGNASVTAARARPALAAAEAMLAHVRSPAAKAVLEPGGMGAPMLSAPRFFSACEGLEGVARGLRKALADLRKPGRGKAAKGQPKGQIAKELTPPEDPRGKRAGGRLPPGMKRVQYQRMGNWLEALDQLLAGESVVTVTFSPVRRFPSLVVGPPNLAPFFRALWRSTYGAALFSATLYHLGDQNRASAGFMRDKLFVDPYGVGPTRAVEFPPCHATWVWNTPTLFFPSAKSAPALTYPSGIEWEEAVPALAGEPAPDPEEKVEPVLKAWWTAVSERVRAISETARGGTLVLCNSYRDAQAVERRLQPLLVLPGTFAPTNGSEPGLPPRVLCQRRGVSLARAKEEFTARYRAGVRPVWLGTGGAWTGLDLRDERAAEGKDDFLLTDLVILRLPFGQNRTAAHLARKRRLGFDVEAAETEIMLRQGLGREVRRDGLLDRRIFVLDGRMVGERAGYYGRIIGALMRYPRRQSF